MDNGEAKELLKGVKYLVYTFIGAAIAGGHFMSTDDVIIDPEQERKVWTLTFGHEIPLPPITQIWDTQVQEDGEEYGRTYRNSRSLIDLKFPWDKASIDDRLNEAAENGEVCSVRVRSITDTKNILRINNCWIPDSSGPAQP